VQPRVDNYKHADKRCKADIPRSTHGDILISSHLAQLVCGFSFRGATAGYQEAFLIEGAHDAQSIVDAALVLIQSHLIAASAQGVSRGTNIVGWSDCELE
jgi:hypothetical protein